MSADDPRLQGEAGACRFSVTTCDKGNGTLVRTVVLMRLAAVQPWVGAVRRVKILGVDWRAAMVTSGVIGQVRRVKILGVDWRGGDGGQPADPVRRVKILGVDWREE